MGGLGSGDKLARGAVRASYSATDGRVTEDKWAEAFGEFDPEKFKNEPNKSMQRAASDSDPDLLPSGDVSALPGSSVEEPITR
jgi:hypothetical protein